MVAQVFNEDVGEGAVASRVGVEAFRCKGYFASCCISEVENLEFILPSVGRNAFR